MSGRFTAKRSHGADCWCGESHEVGWCQLCGEGVQSWRQMALAGPVGAGPHDCQVFHDGDCISTFAAAWLADGGVVRTDKRVKVAVAAIGMRSVRLLELD